ncbi:MAG: hypothetical protein ABSB59_12235 [Streptosporangiaceae bacterium]
MATGAVAMPVKLPAPDAGTDAQPGPKSLAAVAAPEDDADDAMGEEADAIGEDDDEAGAAAVEDPDELHAAVARPRPATRVVAAIRRYFMVLSP